MNPKILLAEEDVESLLTHLMNGESLADWARGPIGSKYRKRLIFLRIEEDPRLQFAVKMSRIAATEGRVEAIDDYLHAEPERYVDGEGNRRIDPNWVQFVRVRADADLRLAAKLNSGKYGDKVAVDSRSEVVTYVVQVPQLTQSTEQWTQLYGSHGSQIPALNKPS